MVRSLGIHTISLLFRVRLIFIRLRPLEQIRGCLSTSIIIINKHKKYFNFSVTICRINHRSKCSNISIINNYCPSGTHKFSVSYKILKWETYTKERTVRKVNQWEQIHRLTDWVVESVTIRDPHKAQTHQAVDPNKVGDACKQNSGSSRGFTECYSLLSPPTFLSSFSFISFKVVLVEFTISQFTGLDRKEDVTEKN